MSMWTYLQHRHIYVVSVKKCSEESKDIHLPFRVTLLWRDRSMRAVKCEFVSVTRDPLKNPTAMVTSSLDLFYMVHVQMV